MTTTHGAVFVVVGTAATIFGASSCRRDNVDTAISETAITSAPFGRVSTDDAVPELAQAECMRQLECPRGTSDAEYATLPECAKHLRRDLALELDPATTCAAGIDRGSLDRCLVAIRAEECGPSGQMSSAVACRVSELCPHVMP